MLDKKSISGLMVALSISLSFQGLTLSTAGAKPESYTSQKSQPSAQEKDVNAAESETDAEFLNSLKPNSTVAGFKYEALYRNADGAPIGGRFRHLQTGFLLDAIEIQTAPQALFYVNTLATSNMGEAHTQEHLLLGKGNIGRSVASQESMSLSSSSAATGQWQTIYHFHTVAGTEVFFDQFKTRLDALLHPDYTDLEIEREVRNFGVKKDAEGGKLALEEKGTVYNEMCSYVLSPTYGLWKTAKRAIYGENHPLSLESGGTPEGLREIKPSDIRTFHDRNYVLSNIGAIAVFPHSIKLRQLLERTSKILVSMQPHSVASESVPVKSTEIHFPPPQCLSDRSPKVIRFPNEDAQKPGDMLLMWPATRNLVSRDQQILELFLSCMGGSTVSPLYKEFIDRKTRVTDIGATSIGMSLETDEGFPITCAMGNVEQSHINEKELGLFRERVLAKIREIAEYPDGSDKLRYFNERAKDRLREARRSLNKALSSPPGFGNRHAGFSWLEMLQQLERSGSFERSLVLKDENDFIDSALQDVTKNPWRRYIKEWRLLDDEPYAFGTKPDPSMVSAENKARDTRFDDELTRLKTKYGATDDQVALEAYKRDYDSGTKTLDALEKNGTPPHLVKDLPMNQDPDIDYEQRTVGGTVPIVSSYFENMTGTYSVIAFDIKGTKPEELLYLSILPSLLTTVGVIEDGKPVAHDDMVERLSKEIFNLHGYLDNDHFNQKSEFLVASGGTNVEESKKSLYWMNLALKHPYIREDNLARIQEVVDQVLSAYRRTREGSYEEHWAHEPQRAYMSQSNPVITNTGNFLTLTHNTQRLKWMLKGNINRSLIDETQLVLEAVSKACNDLDRSTLTAVLRRIAGINGSESEADKLAIKNESVRHLFAVYGDRTPDALKVINDAAQDILANLGDIPDECLVSDVQMLASEISDDLNIKPADTLKRIEAVRQSFLKKSGARMYEVGGKANLAKNQQGIEDLLADLSTEPFTAENYSSANIITERLKQHDKFEGEPIYVGLLNANTHQGVFRNSSPTLRYTNIDDESLKKLLGFSLLSGGAPEGLFMKTWAAGLAYSNGSGVAPNAAIEWTADKCPDLAATLAFVTNQAEHAELPPESVDGAISHFFGSRAASSYESRGGSIAYDLINDKTPSTVQHFREAILKLRERPDLLQQLVPYIQPEYAKLFPGVDPKASIPKGSIYFVIGDKKQFDSYDKYLKSTVGPDATVHRIYGRDYWTNVGKLK